MKKFMKVIALFTALTCIFSTVIVLANEAEIPERVEISFCVGDDTLLINGQETKVETPYVVGEGVTLVPLRVITEAFGATVVWIEETQSIELTYPDVFIVLQIGNPVAEVNQKAEELLAAPELTEAGFTMVPLRFISETFGAVVTYEEETEAITVVKESGESQSTVQGSITEAYLGDSYYNWSIENPKDMYIVDRTFDGVTTQFAYDDANGFMIDFYSISKDFDFEKHFVEVKNSFSGYTLVKAEKNTSDAKKKTAHFQAKTKDTFVNLICIITDKYFIELYGTFANETPEIRDEILRIMDTFDTKFTASLDIHDLSNVKDGVRLFEEEKMNFSMEIPQNYYMSSDRDIENEFSFVNLDSDDDISRIHVGIYSKGEIESAQALAEKDYTNNKNLYNPEFAKYSEAIRTAEYTDFKAIEYDARMSGKEGEEEYFRDVFFELGEYIYNISVRVMLPNEDAEASVTAILNSVKTEEIDAEEVGILLRNALFEDEGTYTSKAGNWSLVLPYSYEELETESDSAYYYRAGTGIGIIMENSREQRVSLPEVGKAMQQNEDSYGEVVDTADRIKIGDLDCHVFTTKVEEDGEVTYLKVYGLAEGGFATFFVVSFPELYYSEANQKEVEEIIASYQFK